VLYVLDVWWVYFIAAITKACSMIPSHFDALGKRREESEKYV